MCNHPHFADTISRVRFRRRGIGPYVLLTAKAKNVGEFNRIVLGCAAIRTSQTQLLGKNFAVVK
jgi:hypothetical protein